MKKFYSNKLSTIVAAVCIALSSQYIPSQAGMIVEDSLSITQIPTNEDILALVKRKVISPEKLHSFILNHFKENKDTLIAGLARQSEKEKQERKNFIIGQMSEAFPQETKKELEARFESMWNPQDEAAKEINETITILENQNAAQIQDRFGNAQFAIKNLLQNWDSILRSDVAGSFKVDLQQWLVKQ